MNWLHAVRVFREVAHLGSLSAAGRRLGMSPATVSRHVTALEHALNASLFHRSSRQMSLTEAGRTYKTMIEPIIAQIDEAKLAVEGLHSNPRGVLRVHSRQMVGAQYLTPLLPKFLDRYPEIDVDLAMSNYEIDIIEKGIDVDIRIGKLSDSALHARKIATSRRIVVASPTFLQIHGDQLKSPSGLVNVSCLTYRLSKGAVIWRFRRGSEEIEVPVTGRLQSDSGMTLLSAVMDGVGVALMSDWAVREAIADGRLVPLFTDYSASHSDYENGIYAVFEKREYLPRKTRVFIDFLCDELAYLNDD
ncbi:LysR family transcriptional regulator [Oricola thermophila]|uniref:LysR family transcriptional regulator n=1 Tax=Oricola thermophila TaxID=2742145 RepID=A0A6N1VI58_9HYPH|nr:LysR family transcriptional regulator [Oricola thermophila]QKV19022.1 LysR family transcriptional regulator [Oricola thermophila]